MKRKGLGKGLGLGYRNLLPMDSFIHSLSAKGIKTCPMAKNIPNKLSTPTVQVLPEYEFNEMFGDEYEDDEVGYATTKIHPNGDVHVYVKDSGDYERNGLLTMHELKEIDIWEDLVRNQCVPVEYADEMAHNLNPVKIEGVSASYELDATN